MKKLVLIAAAFTSLSAFAEIAIVTKSSGSGFVHPDYAKSEYCEVFENRVVITTHYGRNADKSMQLVETIPVALTGNLDGILNAAAAETVEQKDNFLCDGPSTAIYSEKRRAELTLYSTGGCGSPKVERQGPATKMLIDLVNKYCPNTFGKR